MLEHQPQVYVCRDLGGYVTWFNRGRWVARRHDAQVVTKSEAEIMLEQFRVYEHPGTYSLVDVPEQDNE